MGKKVQEITGKLKIEAVPKKERKGSNTRGENRDSNNAKGKSEGKEEKNNKNEIKSGDNQYQVRRKK